MKTPYIAVVALLAGCSTFSNLPAYTEQDVRTAAEIATEYGDTVGAACFSQLAARRIIAPTGPLSAIAAARAVRLGRPMECDSVLLDIRRRISPLGF